MDNPLKILVVEDSEDDYHLLLRELHKGGLSIDAHRVETGMELRNSLRNSWDLVISDNRLPFMNAPEALNITRCYDKDVPFLILSGTIGEEAAVEAMRAGANDYILKGNLARLIPVIEREVQQAKNRKTRKHTERSLLKSQKMYQFLTDSIDDSFLALNQELGMRFTFTDYLDDVSRNYVDPSVLGSDLAVLMSDLSRQNTASVSGDLRDLDNPFIQEIYNRRYDYVGKDGVTYDRIRGFGFESPENVRGNRKENDLYFVTTVKVAFIIGASFRKAKFR